MANQGWTLSFVSSASAATASVEAVVEVVTEVAGTTESELAVSSPPQAANRQTEPREKKRAFMQSPKSKPAHVLRGLPTKRSATSDLDQANPKESGYKLGDLSDIRRRVVAPERKKMSRCDGMVPPVQKNRA